MDLLLETDYLVNTMVRGDLSALFGEIVPHVGMAAAVWGKEPAQQEGSRRRVARGESIAIQQRVLGQEEGMPQESSID